MENILNKEDPIILELLIEAGKRLLEMQRGLSHISSKGPNDIVTEADYYSEEFFQKRITSSFPGDLFLSEEKCRITDEKGLYDRVWVLDPLDGTVNYGYGSPLFCISLGLFVGGKLESSWVYAPALDECFIASRGKGAFLNGQQLDLVKSPVAPLISLSSGFTLAKIEEKQMRRILLEDVPDFHRDIAR